MNYVQFLSVCLLVTKFGLSQGKKDSIILKHAYLPDGGYEVVFVESNKNSNYYRSLRNTDFRLSKDAFKKIGDSFQVRANHTGLSWFAQQWIPLNRYKGKYYLYVPSDKAESSPLMTTDSTLSLSTFDQGVVTAIITDADYTSPVKKIQYVNLIDGKAQMKIHIIDKERQVVVFEYSVYGKKQYQLMVSEKAMRNFPIIITNSTDGKTDEWEFEKIPYGKLIKQKTLSD